MKSIGLLLSSLLFLNCFSLKSYSQDENDVPKIVDFFSEKINTSNKEILVNLHHATWEDNLYLVVIIAFDKDMPIGKVENKYTDYGRYNYKGMNISISSSKDIHIEPSNWKNFIKTSNNSYSNEINMNINYDPETLKFYVDKNLNYVKQFYDDKIEAELQEEINEFLEEN